MIFPVRRYLALLQPLCIALLLIGCAVMLGKLWLSGDKETQNALLTGKRFIVHIEDGKVDGLVAKEEEKDATSLASAVPPPPPPVEIKPEEVPMGAIQPSSSPIASVSDDMVDKSGAVPLPKVPPSGIKPWQYYAKPFRRMNEMPMIAIIVTGLGQSKKTTEQALSLDDRIGLGFSPYANTVASWAAASRLSGHEMYVELPLQTARYPADDPGPFSLMPTHNNNDNMKNLYWAMSRFQGYAGLFAPMDEVMTANTDSFKPLADEIAKRGVLLLLGRDTLPHDDKNQSHDLVSMSADVWIDEELSEMTIQARLATLEQIAQRNGMAIGIAGPYPLSIAQIKHWHETLGERGIVLAPATFLAKLKYN